MSGEGTLRLRIWRDRLTTYRGDSGLKSTSRLRYDTAKTEPSFEWTCELGELGHILMKSSRAMETDVDILIGWN